MCGRRGRLHPCILANLEAADRSSPLASCACEYLGMSTLLRSSHLGDSSSTKKGLRRQGLNLQRQEPKNLLAVLPPISSPTKIIRSPLHRKVKAQPLKPPDGLEFHQAIKSH
mmetsp:Transcript_4113/g.15181  ORF Transcript_4113/g.15181 Transcript_4113/m.15181 type:complete len:112 (+) Transcript_4113:163-498(+)